ncbi:hypothetical protein ABZY81_37900 [Streptomyces sp. NPDC006514]|uniref:hypothetical protein n=1 Tax=Streptomyces sp. NPDC006514 TaxID=3154308 RepID=UPI0033BECB59
MKKINASVDSLDSSLAVTLAWQLAVFEVAIETSAAHPDFLMIHSPPLPVEDNVVVRYSRSGDRPPYGLIDDETTAEEDGHPQPPPPDQP